MNLRSLTTLRWMYRAWYYFRMGYSVYLTFLLGYASTLVTVYYLAVRNMPPLLDIFPRFESFAVLATLVGVPLSIAIGWTHLKRSRAWTSELDISQEANIYNYKLPPGYYREAWVPTFLELLRTVRKLAEREGLLTDQEKRGIQDLEGKLKHLVEGGYVGEPRRAHMA